MGGAATAAPQNSRLCKAREEEVKECLGEMFMADLLTEQIKTEYAVIVHMSH
jgi:hypothetical protein